MTRRGIPGRLRRYQELEELDLPIIVLVGGATGTGKSTIATEVAYRLGITRVTSTDFVRQTMRALLRPELMPTIHHRAEAGVPLHSAEEEEVDPPIHGFLDQTRHVLAGVKAAIDRALEEGGRWCSKVSTVPDAAADRQRAACRALRDRDRERGDARGPLLDPRS